MHPPEVEVTEGNCPLILAMPHSGLLLPPEVAAGLNDTGRKLADTDWHIPQLYDDLLPQGIRANIVRANFHRYLIDVNRDPDGKSLYPGQNTTGLCPLTDFNGEAIWREGCAANEREIKRRIEMFYTPYHRALKQVIDKVKAQYGSVILYDCHSIRSQIPFLFDGVLPDLNIGTYDGKSCAPQIEKIAVDICAASDFSYVLNGRFKGGWTTRHYGNPQAGIHAIQMEIAQSAYMSENESEGWKYLPQRAQKLRAVLAELLKEVLSGQYSNYRQE